MKIGSVQLNGNAALAPLAGFTDVGYRHLAADYGAAITYTEMVSAKGMIYGSEKTRELLATSPAEKIIGVQIFGNDPDIMARAIQFPEMQKFDIIDVNMGCPVPKIVKNGEGSALMRNISQACKVVSKLTQSTDKPITVKCRLGVSMNEFLAVDLAMALQDAGASAITVHGRYREQFYRGEADWQSIAKVVEAVNIPVVANGDVKSLQDYIDILSVTKAQGVMIGRGAIGNPQLFKEIADYQGISIARNENIPLDIMQHIGILKEYYEERYIYSNMKKHLCAYLNGKRGGRVARDKICRVESMDELYSAIEEFFPYQKLSEY